MTEQLQNTSQSSTAVRALRFFLLFALVLSLFATAPATEATLHAHPALLQLAAQQPQQEVSVIVQEMSKSSKVEDTVARLGGKVTKDLSIINAFAAQMQARQIPALASAEGVRWVSPDAPMNDTGCPECIETSKLEKAYPKSVDADKVWNANTLPVYLQGQGITVAVVDSGVTGHRDLGNRIIASVETSSNTNGVSDEYGHGTHVAGIIVGNGTADRGKYVGIAPKANVVNVKVSDDRGASSASDVVAGLQWIYENRTRYNIKVVNMSLNSSVAESYHTSPLCAAAEILWFSGIVVVVSAGNNGTATLYPPANDPFVITVGAVDDYDSAGIGDDTVAPFSAYGTTESGFAKPDLVAPGTNIVSLNAGNGKVLQRAHPSNIVADHYFRMSGTSVAAPMVAGVAALLLQAEPNLNPDQVKYRLKATAVRDWVGYNAQRAGAGYVSIKQAVLGTTTEPANLGIEASQLLWTGGQPITWGSVNWNSVNWNSVNWNAVNWNAVNWNSVNWNSTHWER